MAINLYLASELEYRRGLAHKLLEENVIDFCLADLLPWTNAPEPNDRIVTVDHRPSGYDEYDIICDINTLPALSKSLMEKMLPYESMAIKMGMRRFNYPTVEYEEEKRKYLQQVRYWNYMLDKYNINLIVTHCIPHSQGKFVVYALSRIKGIPMLIWHRSLFDKRCFWGDCLEGIGKSVGIRYLELKKQDVTHFEFDEDISEALLSWGKQREFDKKKHRKQHNIVASIYSDGYKDKRKQYYRQYIRALIRSIIRDEGVEQYKRKDIWFRLCRRQLNAVKYYKKHQCMSPIQYDKVATEPDYLERFVVFFPQVSPEASTIPLAGVFAEQYTSIQLLARAAEKVGISVYVKEHPHNVYRSKDFYEQIKYIPNVKLIKTSVPSSELIRRSIASATQTGSCILESICQKKPCIVFGDGYYWKNCPGVFEMTDENQGSDLLNKLIAGIEIDDIDVKRFFYAIQLESISEVSEAEEVERVLNDSFVVKQFVPEDRIELIKKFIEQHNIK